MRKEVDKDAIKLFGKRLRFIRQSKNMSMEKLAALSDFEYSQISRIEHGHINTTLDTILKLANALEISPKEFFEE